MNLRRWVWAALAFVVAAALGAAALADDPRDLRPAIEARVPEVRWVATATLVAWLAGEGGARPILLDAREAAEFDVSHLAGARRVDPDRTDFGSLDLDRSRRVVVYCSVGWRSGLLADRLRVAGFEVYNLEGGVFQWANEGRPMVTRGGEVARRVHPYDAVWGRLLRPERRHPLNP